jgi:hypothetical protein
MSELTVAHTPTAAPWQVSNERADVMVVAWNIEKDIEEPVAFLTSCNNSAANARLIAAAPDLLAELRSLVKEIKQYHPTFYAHKFVAAERAIAKAGG